METLKLVDPSLLNLPPEQMRLLAPYFVVFGGACLATLVAVVRFVNPKWPIFAVSVATAVLGMAKASALITAPKTMLFGGMMVSDSFSHFFNLLFLFAAFLTLFTSIRYLDKEQLQYPEYYVLTLFSALGMMLMTSATDLISIFISLEIMSLSIYVLVGFRRADRRSNEAAMKYFILGSAASAILLYGAALLYGATGSLAIHDILSAVQSDPSRLSSTFVLGAWMVAAGFLFKVASVPFHMWMPDVYEGAPTPITGFMTTGIKAASFATFVRVFLGLGYGKDVAEAVSHHLHHILWAIAALTMFIGNVVALTQTNLKRMLAYSSIAHTGYILVGLIAAPRSESGISGIVLYLVSYTVMNLGAFGVLSILSGRGDTGLNLQDLSGLSRKHPWLSFSMAVFMFSMAGVPPTAGFAAKYYLFYSAIQAGEVKLTVLAVLCSAISVYYYLRVLVYMYMRDPVDGTERELAPAWATFAVAMMVAMTLQIGVLPAKMVNIAKRAVLSL